MTLCVGAAAVVTGETSLGSTEVYAGAIETTSEMTNPATLSVCYATAASGGDSDDDYTLLEDVFTQVPFVDSLIDRVVSGAAQELDLELCVCCR